jgi:hypothetical protein
MHHEAPDFPTGALLRRCAWCGRVNPAGLEWLEPAVEPDIDQLTHGICPECLSGYGVTPQPSDDRSEDERRDLRTFR